MLNAGTTTAAKIHAVYEDVRPTLDVLHKAMGKHAYSGVSDSEGWSFLRFWLAKKLKASVLVAPISFESLEGYMDYGTSEMPREPGQATKRAIAADIRKAAQAVLKAVMRSCRTHRLEPSDYASMIANDLL